MLVVNKLAVYHIGAPAFVTLIQFIVSTLAVAIGWKMRWVTLDPFDWNKIKLFVVYVSAFSAGTWSNMRVLMVANVETVIVFRACTPLVVCILEYIFYQRALPSRRSVLAMLMVVIGASNYVLHDRSFQTEGLSAYFWVMVWFSLLVFQLTYGKHLVTGIGLKSMWSLVLYTNALSFSDFFGIKFSHPCSGWGLRPHRTIDT